MNGNTRVDLPKRVHVRVTNSMPDGDCGAQGVERFGSVLLCESHVKEAEARKRKNHWEEVAAYLSMREGCPSQGAANPSCAS